MSQFAWASLDIKKEEKYIAKNMQQQTQKQVGKRKETTSQNKRTNELYMMSTELSICHYLLILIYDLKTRFDPLFVLRYCHFYH